ncbi:histidine--tRNA ligase [Buchnera aphidicola (Periphyllus koelreuteriae)]|uniref:histidine--tRNA ligase n=1 Tax=Buchnera aphidicola TaxID=9 RepID=UPI0031B82C13
MWNKTEKILKKIFKNYGYVEIRLPIIEKTKLFYKSIGNVTDIVEKEMYTFLDKNKKNITLRPEGTASCSRAFIENNLSKDIKQRFWYFGPMFRYERPQNGRYRQFYQFGCEVYGLNTPEIDIELIILLNRCWKKLKIENYIFLEINSIGTIESRENYKIDLIKFFILNKKKLDNNSKKRLYTNPLRILDSKNKKIQNLIKKAPILLNYLDKNSKKNFNYICKFLKKLKISYKINTKLIRGLDYYNDTVFEWKIKNKKFLSQNTVCAGGRYDKLINTLGGSSIPALGFAIGMERLISIINEKKKNKKIILSVDIYIISNFNKKNIDHIKISEKIRNFFNKLYIVQDFNIGSIKKKLIRAKKFNSKIIIIINNKKNIQIKHFNSFSIYKISFNKIINYLKIYFKKK